MNRITNVTIMGKEYPLNFSVAAAEIIGERYGGIENLGDAMSGENTAGMMGQLTWILSVLIDQGAKYKKIMEGEEVKPLPLESLQVILGMQELMELQSAIMDAITAGTSVTVEAENAEEADALEADALAEEPEGKNGNTTQKK